ncbi:MAG: hypothetical protein BGO45_10760 [Microbacterium sp. 71-36]|uniref:hypothetical protein n=1 Tax=unclassified Microbacterium TaxID=2609290 RepID=UPI00086D2770|nr:MULTISPECIES: hypothetical protein [unclassified Microbacterium]MBN9210747.1 hypothetical protein [Microbacterium sp.]ODT36043.1 MAG: hypothetical protein ABS60_16800 [Microbacterium sp. SCN 71-17]OJV77268.1 MAG: hypothetical protein BGO45_10760 [Microbacterium sp. 71-36]
MSRFEMVACDFVFPDGDSCGSRSAVFIANGWYLGGSTGGADFCPRHKPRGDDGGSGAPIPLRAAA